MKHLLTTSYLVALTAILISLSCGIKSEQKEDNTATKAEHKQDDQQIIIPPPLTAKATLSTPPTTYATTDITDKYKTIEDLILAIENGDTITEEITKKFADKQAPNSITTEQICKIIKTAKVNEEVLTTLAEKATLTLQDLESESTTYLSEIPYNILAKMLNNMTSNKINISTTIKALNNQALSPKKAKLLIKKTQADKNSFGILLSLKKEEIKNLPKDALLTFISQLPQLNNEEAESKKIIQICFEKSYAKKIRLALLNKLGEFQASFFIEEVEDIKQNIKETHIDEDELEILIEKLVLSSFERTRQKEEIEKILKNIKFKKTWKIAKNSILNYKAQ
jgi:hypothetical protein